MADDDRRRITAVLFALAKAMDAEVRGERTAFAMGYRRGADEVRWVARLIRDREEADLLRPTFRERDDD